MVQPSIDGIESVLVSGNPVDLRALFRARYPNFDLDAVDELRRNEYGRLDEQKQIYLDYTGGGLHASTQVAHHVALLSREVLGNPHSNNPTSLAMTILVEDARASVLRYFRADPEDYIAVFTPNASGALKHVGESYPFDSQSRLVLSFDNHNSVNGIREFARSKGATFEYVPLTAAELRLDMDALDRALAVPKEGVNHLFAFPAQSNFSGAQHPLALIGYAQEAGYDVLLDAAAYVPTNRLDLSIVKPQFVSISFYKMFGFPTGLGCLLVRRDGLGKLRRPWFAGGTIAIASVQGDGHYYADGEAAFEDGTVDYLNIPAVKDGLDHIESVGIEVIHDRVTIFTGFLLEALRQLRHSNGEPIVAVLGPQSVEDRGGTVTVTFLDPEGESLDERRVEELANQVNISLRTGCFCNPGAGEIAHQLSAEEMKAFFAEGEHFSFDELRDRIRSEFGKSVASIRLSVGIATNLADIDALLRFVAGFRDRRAADVGPPSDAVPRSVERQVV